MKAAPPSGPEGDRLRQDAIGLRKAEEIPIGADLAIGTIGGDQLAAKGPIGKGRRANRIPVLSGNAMPGQLRIATPIGNSIAKSAGRDPGKENEITLRKDCMAADQIAPASAEKKLRKRRKAA